jgi:hypothetical protein
MEELLAALTTTSALELAMTSLAQELGSLGGVAAVAATLSATDSSQAAEKAHPRYQPGVTRLVQSAPVGSRVFLPAEDDVERNEFGFFAQLPPPEAELARMASLRRDAPDYCRALVQQGQTLCRLAAANDVRGVIALVTSSREVSARPWSLRQGEIPRYFVTQMVVAAAASSSIDVLRYLVAEGLTGAEAGVPDLLHLVIERAPREELALGLVRLLVRQAGCDPDAQRRPDYASPLHLACTRAWPRLVRFLVE